MAAGLYTIPSWIPFVDALAQGVVDEYRGDRLAMSGLTIFLPTRRACRALAEAFLRVTDGDATLLPRLRPLGEADEDEIELASFHTGAAGSASAVDLPPAIADTRRQLLLAQTIIARDTATPPEQAAWLARELAVLLDQVQTERLSFDKLEGLVADRFAAHWQTTLEFLKVLTEVWPDILKAEGAMDPAARRNELLSAETGLWSSEEPPATHAGPVIAAGSTGSIPATADLLAAIAGNAQGRIVLPGLDQSIDDDIWDSLDPPHPQFGMKRLLDRLDAGRPDVEVWSGCGPVEANRSGEDRTLPDRAGFFAEVLRPAETTESWIAGKLDAKAFEPALRAVQRVDCADPRAEAGVIALKLREALEVPGRTAALITPDRQLARRVSAELKRWNIDIDDSAGVPLTQTPPGTFLRMTAALVAEDFAPVPLLSVLKHPLARGGMDPAAFRANARTLERAVLRGPRPGAGISGLITALNGWIDAAGEDAALRQRRRIILHWVEGLHRMAAPFDVHADRATAPLAAMLTAHFRFAEALATGPAEADSGGLWSGEDGEQAAAFASDAIRAAEGFPDISIQQYPGLLDALLAGRVVRPRFGRHPRLNIWGPLEARLQHADVLVLGGLNEGTWPRSPDADPWMSREMRLAFGLPAPERRIGQSAHDFAQATAAREVLLTRARKIDGAPTVPSRWLLRMETVIAALDPEEKDKDTLQPLRHGEGRFFHWQRMLDDPGPSKPYERPSPRPPAARRPKELSVTGIEMWRRNPYGVYARYILGLRKLDPIDADPGAAEYGSVIHAALDAFIRMHPETLPDDIESTLLACGREAFGDLLHSRPGVMAFWWPRFERIAAWFAGYEPAHRARGVARSLSEIKGAAAFGNLTITAKADRIDVLAGGPLEIVDYKTGAPPDPKEVHEGLAPQLPLEAVIAAAGGFPGIAPGDGEIGLHYWQLKGGNPPADIRPAGGKRNPAHQKLADDAKDWLIRMVAAFGKDATPYYATPHPAGAPKFDDYEHLARTREWSAGGSDSDGGGGE